MLDDYPSYLTAQDLVDLGLFPSKLCVQLARRRGGAPPWANFGGRRVRFPKDELIKWIESKKKTTKEKTNDPITTC